MKRDAFTQQLDFGHELVIDNFAGGGGTSTGLEAALGRPVDIAINHDREALAMHAINHPRTQHLLQSVWDVDPVSVTNNRPVGLVWLSPDCKHFSKAKGGTPVSKKIRGLAWVGMRWIALTRPRVLMLENVEEFTTWGPLMRVEVTKRDAAGGLYIEHEWRPDPKKKGITFESFVRQLRQHGYRVEWRERRACNAGAPTIRKRLFLIARRDGLPIVWPRPTHHAPTSREVQTRRAKPWRTAAECIDFGLPSESIFGRKKALAENTLRRVAKGLWRHVLTNPQPFVVTNTTGHSGSAIDAPLPTITTGGHHMLGQPVMTPFIAKYRADSAGSPIDEPMPTITANSFKKRPGGAAPIALAAAALTPFLTEHANASNQRTMPADEPLRTICAQVKGGHFSVVAPALAPLRGTSDAHLGGHSVESPLSTVSAGGTHHALMAAHLTHLTHHGERSGHACDAPLPTITAAHRGEQALVAAHMVTVGYGERPGQDARTHACTEPLGTVVAGGVKRALVSAAFLEQANGGFYDGDGRSVAEPASTITASGSQQRLVSAYLVKYYSSGGQWQGVVEPMHTLPTKGRMGLVQTVTVSAECIAPELLARARECAALLHRFLPEHFPTPADLVLFGDYVLVDITLRMLKAPELFRAQGFPSHYVIHEIPDPDLLFKDGVQVADPLSVPRIKLSATAQVRMCGNSVSPPEAEALARANFAHEAAWRLSA
jgi:DNA (cytosine-5)-methyltransferase 1